jgi:phospholipid/cholesterol/gamma-HCH transport system permease protein
MLLDGFVSVAGIAGGYFFNVVIQGGTPGAYLASFSLLAQTADLIVAIMKAGVFGLVAAMVAVYFGFYAKGGPKGVGDAVNRAVVVTFMLIFFVNFILTALYFAIVPQKFG